jgi:hypothetical protein
MTNDLFRTVCEELGYAAEDVRSIRINASEAVVVVMTAAGELQVTTHRANDARTRGTPRPLRRRGVGAPT